MYIFNYIIANPDLHDDNYGLLYDSDTFEFKSVSPCYDHNVAFQEGFLGLSRTTIGNSASIPLDDLCKRFIVGHKDIAEKLKLIDLENVKELFGESTRGKRLKSLDRVAGNLPFVTAGEENEGISAYIGNDVHIFSENTSTIDMFGSAKYRNYKYGADDHIAVVHTENIPKYAAMFITTAFHKAAHTGQFDYSRNFYAKDADALTISLPHKILNLITIIWNFL